MVFSPSIVAEGLRKYILVSPGSNKISKEKNSRNTTLIAPTTTIPGKQHDQWGGDAQ